MCVEPGLVSLMLPRVLCLYTSKAVFGFEREKDDIGNMCGSSHIVVKKKEKKDFNNIFLIIF